MNEPVRGRLLRSLLGLAIVVASIPAALGVARGWTRVTLVRSGAMASTGPFGDPSQGGTLAIQLFSPDGNRDSLVLRGRTLLLYTAVDCLQCSYNMPRWIDLIAEARGRDPSLRIVVISVDADSVSRSYWRPLESEVEFARIPSPNVALNTLHAVGTPATIVHRDGAILSTSIGFLGPRRRQYIMRVLEEES